MIINDYNLQDDRQEMKKGVPAGQFGGLSLFIYRPLSRNPNPNHA